MEQHGIWCCCCVLGHVDCGTTPCLVQTLHVLVMTGVYDKQVSGGLNCIFIFVYLGVLLGTGLC